MIKYQLFPRSFGITKEIKNVVDCFKSVDDKIKSPNNNLTSNGVLSFLRPKLKEIGFNVEAGKSKGEKLQIPVLFGMNNKIDKCFDADAISSDYKIVLEVEAGRAVTNYQFLKDIFQACMMCGVEYLIIAVRNDYRKSDDFQKIYTFLETLYISNRINLPLKGDIQ